MNLEEKTIPYEKAIRTIVKSSIETFSKNFSERHISQKKDTEGVINMKIHNVFVAHLGEEIQYYSALARSFDSSLGNMLEDLAIDIAKLFFTVEKKITGPLYPEQISKIAELLEAYKNRNNDLKVEVAHYELIKNLNLDTEVVEKTHNSDYYLVDEITKENFIIELKIGGDLDNKKARSEKEALMEQFAILSNTLGDKAEITCYFATAYNRFGENQPWTQGRVKQFFSEDELLIGKDFWNFICKSDFGYEVVLDEYKQNSYLITDSLQKIKETYL